MKQQAIREETQASNLYHRIFIDDPEAKVLVYAGRAHIAETLDSMQLEEGAMEFGMMAGYFKRISKIDPFTIDQLEHSEYSQPSYESSVFKSLKDAKIPDLAPFNVLIKKSTGEPLGAAGYYDVTLVESPTKYVNGRPDWLVTLPGYQSLDVDLTAYQPTDSGYYMVQAVYTTEDADLAVPADQLAYSKGQLKTSLLLRAGTYTLRILDGKGQTLHEWQKTIK